MKPLLMGCRLLRGRALFWLWAAGFALRSWPFSITIMNGFEV